MVDLYNIRNLKELCDEHKLIPSKKYGQSFLITPKPIEKMLEAGAINKKDFVVEVGPGFGPLTFSLADKVKKVLSFEIEKRLVEYWGEYKPKNVEIVFGDVLKTFDNYKLPNKYKFIANLPYQITSKIIRNFLESDNQPEKMVLMVQREVAERICAKPGSMSILAVSVQYYGDPKLIYKVPSTNFWPEPKVNSAVILIDNIAKRNNKNFDKMFFKVVKQGFANKRKKLINNLKSFKNIGVIFDSLKLDKNIRAQELSVEQWEEMVKKI